MAAVRDTFCNIGPMEIPRPKCEGFQFITTRGRMGFYRSIKLNGGKYGLKINSQGPRRPTLPDSFYRSSSTEQENIHQSPTTPDAPPLPSSAPPTTTSFLRHDFFTNINGNAAKPPLPPNATRLNGLNNNNNIRYGLNGFNGNGKMSPHGFAPSLAMLPPVTEPEPTFPEPDYDMSDTAETPKQQSSRASSISRKSSENGSVGKRSENSDKIDKTSQKVTFVTEKF